MATELAPTPPPAEDDNPWKGLKPKDIFTDPSFYNLSKEARRIIASKVSPSFAAAPPEDQDITLGESIEYWNKYFEPEPVEEPGIIDKVVGYFGRGRELQTQDATLQAARPRPKKKAATQATPSAELPAEFGAPPAIDDLVAEQKNRRPPKGVKGLIIPGNIDLSSRPVTQNADGSQSTVYSKSFAADEKVYLVPGALDGSWQLPDDEASVRLDRPLSETIALSQAGQGTPTLGPEWRNLSKEQKDKIIKERKQKVLELSKPMDLSTAKVDLTEVSLGREVPRWVRTEEDIKNWALSEASSQPIPTYTVIHGRIYQKLESPPPPTEQDVEQMQLERLKKGLPPVPSSRGENAVMAAMHGFASGLPSAIKSTAAIKHMWDMANNIDYEAAARGETPPMPKLEESMLWRAGQHIQEKINAGLPINPAFQNEFWSTMIPQAVGSTAFFMTVGALGAGMGLPAAAVTAGAGAAVQVGPMYEEAYFSGATPEQLYGTAVMAMGLGASEALPIKRALGRFDRVSGGFVSKFIKNKAIAGPIKEGISGWAEEFAQETFQSLGQDWVLSTVDPSRKMNAADDIRQGTAGGVAGFAFSALMSSLGVANMRQQMRVAMANRRDEIKARLEAAGVPPEEIKTRLGILRSQEKQAIRKLEKEMEEAQKKADKKVEENKKITGTEAVMVLDPNSGAVIAVQGRDDYERAKRAEYASAMGIPTEELDRMIEEGKISDQEVEEAAPVPGTGANEAPEITPPTPQQIDALHQEARELAVGKRQAVLIPRGVESAERKSVISASGPGSRVFWTTDGAVVYDPKQISPNAIMAMMLEGRQDEWATSTAARTLAPGPAAAAPQSEGSSSTTPTAPSASEDPLAAQGVSQGSLYEETVRLSREAKPGEAVPDAASTDESVKHAIELALTLQSGDRFEDGFGLITGRIVRSTNKRTGHELIYIVHAGNQEIDGAPLAMIARRVLPDGEWEYDKKGIYYVERGKFSREEARPEEGQQEEQGAQGGKQEGQEGQAGQQEGAEELPIGRGGPDRRGGPRPGTPDRRQDFARRKQVSEMTREEIEHELLTDELTGLRNRSAWERAPFKKFVASIDLDKMKRINDTYGLEEGDRYLQQAAKGFMASGITVYRLGGDDFVLKADTREEIDAAMARAKQWFKDNPLTVGGSQETVGFSYGVEESPAAAFKKMKEAKEAAIEKGEIEARHGKLPAEMSKSPIDLGAGGAGEEGRKPQRTGPLHQHFESVATIDPKIFRVINGSMNRAEQAGVADDILIGLIAGKSRDEIAKGIIANHSERLNQAGTPLSEVSLRQMIASIKQLKGIPDAFAPEFSAWQEGAQEILKSWTRSQEEAPASEEESGSAEEPTEESQKTYGAEIRVQGKWSGNSVRFSTKAEAEAYGLMKFTTWVAAEEYRVVESEDPANWRWDPEKNDIVALTKPAEKPPEPIKINWDPIHGIGEVPNGHDIDYFGYLVELTPDQFLALVPSKGLAETGKVEELIRGGAAVAPPFLKVTWNAGAREWKVVDHEGRSRARAIRNLSPDTLLQVQVFPENMRARNLTPEMKAAPLIPQEGSASTIEIVPTVIESKAVDLTGAGESSADKVLIGLFEALKAGSDTFAGVKDPILVAAKPAFDEGLINSPEELSAWITKNYYVQAPIKAPEDSDSLPTTDDGSSRFGFGLKVVKDNTQLLFSPSQQKALFEMEYERAQAIVGQRLFKSKGRDPRLAAALTEVMESLKHDHETKLAQNKPAETAPPVTESEQEAPEGESGPEPVDIKETDALKRIRERMKAKLGSRGKLEMADPNSGSAPTADEMLDDPEILDIMGELGGEYYNQGVTDRAKWHASLYAELDAMAGGLGRDLEPLFAMTWSSVTGEEDYAGGTGGVYGARAEEGDAESQAGGVPTDGGEAGGAHGGVQPPGVEGLGGLGQAPGVPGREGAAGEAGVSGEPEGGSEPAAGGGSSEPGAVPGAGVDTGGAWLRIGEVDYDKPQGLYIGRESSNVLVGLDGPITEFRVEPVNPLVVPALEKALTSRYRGNQIELSAGIKAFRILVPNDADRLIQLSKAELLPILSEMYPSVDWSMFYDGYEMLEGVAGILARNQGYDSIIGDPEEMVVLDRSIVTSEEKQEERPPRESGRFFKYTPDVEFGKGGWGGKLEQNIDAIVLVKKLQQEGRLPTEEEKIVLARFIGWGALWRVFDRKHSQYYETRRKLRHLLTEEEYKRAVASTQNAHYTAEPIARSLWEIVDRLGFKGGGTVLEGAAGVGVILGTAPDHIANTSQFFGTELDPITAAIAGYLYPAAKIFPRGFQNLEFPDGSVDLAISNVPFGGKIFDKRYDALNPAIHDYYFLKTVDKLRAGGLLVYITSIYTMDKKSDHIRRMLADKADMVAAFRLPNGAFMSNAGTGVATDIIILQKRAPGQESNGLNWVKSDSVRVPDKVNGGDAHINLNEYYQLHPQNILGSMARGRGLNSSQDPIVVPTPHAESGFADLAEAVNYMIRQSGLDKLPADIYQPAPESSPRETVQFLERFADSSVWEKQIIIDENGNLMRKVDGFLQPLEDELNSIPTAVEMIKDLIGVREALWEVFRTQLSTNDDEALKISQDALNKAYDFFLDKWRSGASKGSKFMYMNDRKVKAAFGSDPSYYFLVSLEEVNQDDGTVTKSPIFTERSMRPSMPLESLPEDLRQAMLMVYAHRGYLDLELMASLSDKTAAQWEEELKSAKLVFRNPVTGSLELAEDYLSGDIYDKIDDAQKGLPLDPTLSANIEALEAVLPERVLIDNPADPKQVFEARLGVSWISDTVYEDFIRYLFENQDLEIDIGRSKAGGYTVKIKGNMSPYIRYKKWGTERKPAEQLIVLAMNQKKPVVYDEVDDHLVRNPVKTKEAQLVQTKIREEFVKWARVGPYSAQLEELYNRTFNRVRLRQYDGSHLNFEGMNRSILRGNELEPHQRNAVWRIILEGRALLAHFVGSGKTFEMTAAAMEMRRLGLVKKTMVSVPKNIYRQFGADFARLYPGAKLLVVDEKDFEAKNRKKLFARIAMEDWDAVIISHEQLAKIPMSPEWTARMINEEIDEIEEQIREMGNPGTKAQAVTLKRLQKRLDDYRAQLQHLLNMRQDDTVYFDQMGVDMLMVDEAHAYKNLPILTSMGQIAGLGGGTSKRALTLKAKTDFLLEKNNGRGVVFATGTPVSNSMVELYNFNKFLDPTGLRTSGVNRFDSWAANFGEVKLIVGIGPDGRSLRPQTVFGEFTNLTELQQMFRKYADVITREMINLPIPSQINEKGEPDKPTVVKVIPDAATDEYFEQIKERLKFLDDNPNHDKKLDNILVIMNDARLASLDMRLVDGKADDNPDSKANQCVRMMASYYKDHMDDRRTQVAFTGNFRNSKTGFNLYEDMRQKLIEAGVPENEVAVIHDYKTDEEVRQLYKQLREGQVRILLTTKKTAEGANIQTRLGRLYHLDAPWTPKEIEQREGRIIRQGNLHYQWNEPVAVVQFVTERTLDSRLFEILRRKARFIRQYLKGDSNVRKASDPAAKVVVTYEMISAEASGNPEYLIKVQLEQQVADLEILRERHLDNQRTLQNDLNNQTRIQTNAKQEIAYYQSAIDEFEKQREPFAINIDGQAFTDPDDAVESVRKKRDTGVPNPKIAEGKELEPGEPEIVPYKPFTSGRYVTPEEAIEKINYKADPENRNFKFNAVVAGKRYEKEADAENAIVDAIAPYKDVEGKSFIEIEVYGFPAKIEISNYKKGNIRTISLTFLRSNRGIDSAPAAVKSMVHYLHDMKRRIITEQARIDATKEEIERIQEAMGKPWEQQEEYFEAKTDLREVNGRLGLSDPDEEGSISTEETGEVTDADEGGAATDDEDDGDDDGYSSEIGDQLFDIISPYSDIGVPGSGPEGAGDAVRAEASRSSASVSGRMPASEGDSQVLQLYRGDSSSADGIGSGSVGDLGRGIYFAESSMAAEYFTDGTDKGHTREFSVTIRNPFDLGDRNISRNPEWKAMLDTVADKGSRDLLERWAAGDLDVRNEYALLAREFGQTPETFNDFLAQHGFDAVVGYGIRGIAEGSRQYVVFSKSQVDQGAGPGGGGTTTDSPAFKEWFKKSKVVKANGNPLPMKHGGRFDETKGKAPNTSADGFYFTEDDSVSQSYAKGGGQVTTAYLALQDPFMPDNEDHVGAKWVKDWIDFWREESGWTDRESGGEMSDAEVLDMIRGVRLYEYESDGSGERWHDFLGTVREHHDGFFGADPTEGGAKIAVVFDPTKIKSVNNDGTFDPENPDILRDQGPGGDLAEEDLAAREPAPIIKNLPFIPKEEEYGPEFLYSQALDQQTIDLLNKGQVPQDFLDNLKSSANRRLAKIQRVSTMPSNKGWEISDGITLLRLERTEINGAPGLQVWDILSYGRIQIPELLWLVKQVTGKNMGINKRLRTFLGHFVPSGEGGLVEVRPDLAYELKDREQLARTIAHEVGHAIDYAPDNDIAKGNLIGRLLSLHKFLKQTYTLNGETLRNKTIKAELTALSDYWRPWDQANAPKWFRDYRASPVELYADFLSAVLNSPGTVWRMAPTAYRVFHLELDRKPAVKDAYIKLRLMMSGTPEQLLDHRLERLGAMFMESERAEMRMLLGENERDYSWWGGVRDQFDDRRWEIKKRVRKAVASGSYAPVEDANPEYLWDELPSKLRTDNYLYQKKVRELCVMPLEARGMTFRHISEYLLLNRAATERANVLSPVVGLGEYAFETLEHMKKVLGDERFKLVEKSAKIYHDLRWELIEAAQASGIYSEDLVKKVFEPSKYTYAKFTPIQYIKDWVSAHVQAQTGFTGDIASPFTETLKMDQSLMYLTARNNAVKATLNFIREFYPEEIMPAHRKDGNPKEKPQYHDAPTGFALVEVMVDGKPVGYYVDKYIAESCNEISPERVNSLVLIAQTYSRKWFWPLAILYNFGFGTWGNPHRDFWTNFRKLPLKTAVVGDFVQLLAGYAKAAPPVFRWMWKDKQADPLVNEMIESYAYSMPLSDLVADEEDPYLMQLKKAGIVKGTGAINRSRAAKIIYGGLHVIGTPMRFLMQFTEMQGKLAGYQIRKEAGETGKKLAFNMRNFTSTPNYDVKGSKQNTTNALFVFSTIMKEGWKSEYLVATEPATRSGYWLRTSKLLVLKMIQVLAELGLLNAIFGDDLEKKYKSASKYMKDNYLLSILPGSDVNDEGKVFFVPLPQDEMTRVLSIILRHSMIAMFRDNPKNLEDMTRALFANLSPSLTPLITTAVGWGSFLNNVNFLDGYRQTPVFSDLVQKAGGWKRWEKMLLWTLNENGLGQFATYDDSAKTWYQMLTQFDPTIGRLLGRALKQTNYGLVEAEKDELEAKEREDAIRTIAKKSATPAVAKFYSSKYQVDRQQVIIKAAVAKGGDMRQLMQEYPEAVWSKLFNKSASAINTLQKRIDLIEKDSKLSRKDKDLQKISIRQQMDRIAKQALISSGKMPSPSQDELPEEFGNPPDIE